MKEKGGVSGRFFHPHVKDQTKAFINGEKVSWRLSDQAIQENKKGTLLLKPGEHSQAGFAGNLLRSKDFSSSFLFQDDPRPFFLPGTVRLFWGRNFGILLRKKYSIRPGDSNLL